MGGLPCWKEIIDQANRLWGMVTQGFSAIWCMGVSITIAGAIKGDAMNLDRDDVNAFHKKARAVKDAVDELAKEAARIQEKVEVTEGY